MIKAIEFNLETRAIRVLPQEEFSVEPASGSIRWFHVDLDDDGNFANRCRELGMSDEDVARLSEPEPRPSVDVDQASLLVVLPYWSASKDESSSETLAIYLTDRICVTASPTMLPCIQQFERSYKREVQFATSPGFVLFLVLDYLIDEFADMVAPLDEACEALDERIHGPTDKEINRDILTLKRRVLTLKRVVGHSREVIARLSSRRISVVTEPCRQSLGDLGKHAESVLTSVDSLRDMVNGSFESYQSVLAQRLNEIMKVLTMVSLAILPMTLIAGIYGMNFQTMPELGWRLGYPAALGLMLAAAAGVVAYFKHRGWL